MKTIKLETNRYYRADIIRAAMGAGVISNEELARLANLTPRTVSRLRQGRDTRISTLHRVADALNIKMLDLVPSPSERRSKAA